MMLWNTFMSIPLWCFVYGSFVNGNTKSVTCANNRTIGRDCQLQCNCISGCYADGQCISGGCMEQWYGPTCRIRLENVVFAKPTEQGLESKHEASLAVDGNLNQTTNWAWARSSGEKRVWWSVDVGSLKRIFNLTVLFRYLDSSHDDYNRVEKRRRGFSIWISNDSSPLANKGVQCYHDSSTNISRHVISITDCVDPARYIRIYNSRTNGMDKNLYSKLPNLEITEVVALGDVGCVDGTYGKQCDKECGRCFTANCSRRAGRCSKCMQGWTGNTCQQVIDGVCDNNKFGTDCKLECHCARSKICQDGICTSCDDGWAGPTCQIKLENIALGKPSFQGPTTKNNKLADFAVDGNSSSYSWAQSGKANSVSYWFVDLGGVHKIHSISVSFYNPVPEDANVEKRRPGYSIRVSNISSTTDTTTGGLCYQDRAEGSTKSMVTFLNCTYTGQYVMLFNARTTGDPNDWSLWPNLELNEVKIMEDKGCSSGTYGQECDQDCPCAAAECDRLGGCVALVKCENCNNPDNEADGCMLGWYSDSCTLPCPVGCAGSGCDKETGKCSGECIGGFYGDYCNEKCSKNCADDFCQNDGSCNGCNSHSYYGSTCDLPCDNCIDGCFQNNGTCRNGCKDKYYGDKCDEPCDQCASGCKRNGICKAGGCVGGYHGDMCKLECDDKCLDKSCFQNTGKCEKCELGQYGDVCGSTCDYCLDRKCNRKGECEEGCSNKSYTGEVCDIPCANQTPNCLECFVLDNAVQCKKCSSAKFGVECKLQCPSHCELCTDDNTCTKCEIGFTGPTCSTVCNIANCKYCDQNTSGKCKECEAGLYGDDCQFSCPEKCESCRSIETNQTQCLTCKKGSFLESLDCLKCLGQCTVCSSARICTECQDGYYGNRCTEKCPKHCVKCSSKNICSECSPDRFGETCQCSNNCSMDGNIEDWCAANGTCLKGCKAGYFGMECESRCRSDCVTCNQDTGMCLECQSGRYGNICNKSCGNCKPDDKGQVRCDVVDGTCQADCALGYFGNSCKQSCDDNCDNSGCSKTSGDCHTCKDGFYGQKCNMPCGLACLSTSDVNQCDRQTGYCDKCMGFYYGDRCDRQCAVNCDGGCDKTTGECDLCKSNYFGSFCEKKCPAKCGPDLESEIDKTKITCQKNNGECLFCKIGFYGEICDKECSLTCEKEMSKKVPECFKSNGNCKKCIHGRTGDYCRDNCSANCGKTVGSSLGKGSCDQENGDCDFGCAPGWHNRTCEVKCSSTCKEERCNQTNAQCLQGCVPGYTGPVCQDRLPVKDSGISIIIGVIIVFAVLLLIGVAGACIYFKRRKGTTGRKSNGYTDRTDMRLCDIEVITPATEPLLYKNGNGRVNHLSVPARKPKTAVQADDDLLDNDESIPLMSAKSTDPSDYYNLSSVIPVASFAEYVQKRKMESLFWYKDDFAKLPKGLLKSCHIASLPSNKGKCRYKQLYPYDHTRVKLDPDDDVKSDFINASYIGGYKEPDAFIAAQGPIDVNLNDFWRMIWQKDCGKIVMLTNLFEECKMKCVSYWPELNESETYGRIEVVMVGETIYPDYTVRDLVATHMVTKEVKDFKHFHFTAWPDRGVPDSPSCMLHFRDKVSEEATLLDGPMLVHCSAGIGRTGTFIALDYLLKQAHTESNVDVFRTITDMRYQRTNFIQTDIQYEFLHHAIAEALTTNDMEVAASNFNQFYWSLLNINPETGKTKMQEHFEILQQMSPVLEESCFSSGKNSENFGKNRYAEILPVDTYRAFLSTPVKGSNEYINAVFLPTSGSKTGFLLTQMPLPHTVTDFWRLVYDQRVTNIVMMNNVDDNDEDVGEYWPSDDSTYGPFKVELLSLENHDVYSTMSIQLTHSSLSKQTTMSVKLFRFESWEDHESLPISTAALTTLIGAVSRSPKENIDEPIIVHCMDGAERSGLYSVVSAILERLQKDQKVNITQTILQLRNRRPQLIPTLEQFDFCHRAIRDYMEATQIYSNVI